MMLLLVVVAIFVLSVAVGSLIGSALASLVINGMERRLAESRDAAASPPSR